RMPRVEDFPPVAQRQLRAQQSPNRTDDERRPRGLLARLTSGLTRRDDPEQAPNPQVKEEPRIVQAQPPVHPAATPAAEFAKQPQPRRMGEGQAASGSLDPRG